MSGGRSTVNGFVRLVLARLIWLGVSALGLVGLSRGDVVVRLPLRIRNWLWMLKLPRSMAVRHPSGKLVRFPRTRTSETYKSYYWGNWNSFESDTTRFVLENAKVYSWFVDIGAYIGHYILTVRLQNPDIAVRCFEPVPDIAEALRENLNANAIDNVELVQAAVGTGIGHIDFYLPERSLSELSSIGSVNNRFGDGAEHSARGCVVVQVEGVEAANILDGLPEGRGLIKIDTEGSEAAIITGLHEALDTRQPDLIFELIHPPEGPVAEIEETLSARGYRFYLLTEGHPEIPSLVDIDPKILPNTKTTLDIVWGEVFATVHPM
jgi:FkbM family methyltransferase